MEEEEMALDGLKLPNQDEDEEDDYGGEEGEDEQEEEQGSDMEN
jgi:U3 small nucleolar RNA-associated protein MPP10